MNATNKTAMSKIARALEDSGLRASLVAHDENEPLVVRRAALRLLKKIMAASKDADHIIFAYSYFSE